MSSKDNSEIEKKFEVLNNKWFYGSMKTQEIFQAYFKDEDGRNKRIRLIPTEVRAIVTEKKDLGVIDGVLEREEIEYDINFSKGLNIFLDCPSFIHKIRHFAPFHDFTFEIDKYVNLTTPLVTAEVEMKKHQIAEFNKLQLPDWIGEDWTLNKDYTNFNLMKKVDPSLVVPIYLKKMAGVDTGVDEKNKPRIK